MTDTAPAVQEEREAPASRSLGAGNLIIKIILVGLIDALLIYCLAQAWGAEWWPAVVLFVATCWSRSTPSISPRGHCH